MKSKTRRHSLGPILLLAGCLLMTATFAAAANEKNEANMDYEAGFYYTVKKGDTLWDLSQRFSDSPWQWPDLWRENKQLTNPHWIYPGERIRLFRKSGLHKGEKDDLKGVPTVTAQVQASTQEKPKIEVGFHYANIDRVGFIREPAVQPLGIIFKSLGDKKLISKGDTVYLQYSGENDDAFQPGARMTVYRTIDPKAKDTTKKSVGNQHYLLGIAEIVTVEPQYAIAKMIESFRAIFLEDKVMLYEPRSTDMTVVDSTSGLKAQIIVAEDHNKLLGDHMVAFMDKGTDDQIEIGQIYNIYRQETANIGSEKGVSLNPVEIGTLIVLHTERDNATVYITDSSDRIASGQLILGP